MDLVVPPLTYIGLWVMAGTALECVHVVLTGEIGAGVALWASALTLLGAYVARGVQYSGLGGEGLVALLYAPVYVTWKVLIARPFKLESGGEWIRTRREPEKASDSEASSRIP